MVTIDYSKEADRPKISEVILVKKRDQMFFRDETELLAEIFCEDGNVFLIRLNPPFNDFAVIKPVEVTRD